MTKEKLLAVVKLVVQTEIRDESLLLILGRLVLLVYKVVLAVTVFQPMGMPMGEERQM